MGVKITTCPFCGSVAEIQFSHGSNQRYIDKQGHYTNTKSLYCIECKNCLAKTHDYEEIEMAIDAWNRRVEDAD